MAQCSPRNPGAASDAQSTTDTYPAIAIPLTKLKERHSFLQFPATMPKSEKKLLSARIDAILEPYRLQFPSRPDSVFADRSTPSGKLVHVGEEAFADVIIPTCWQTHSGPQQENYNESYAESLHSAAAALEANHPAGWIIDLRGNGGGNMYPMIAGIGFVLGEVLLGYFASVGGAANDWRFYRQGAAGETENRHEATYAKITVSPFAEELFSRRDSSRWWNSQFRRSPSHLFHWPSRDPYIRRPYRGVYNS